MRFEFELLGMRLTFEPVADEYEDDDAPVSTLERRLGASTDFGFSPDPAFIDKYPE